MIIIIYKLNICVYIMFKHLLLLILITYTQCIYITVLAAHEIDDLVGHEVREITKIPNKNLINGVQEKTCRINPDEFSVLTLSDIDLMLNDCKKNNKKVLEIAYCKDILNSGIMMEKFIFIRNNYCNLKNPFFNEFVNVNLNNKCSYYINSCSLGID